MIKLGVNIDHVATLRQARGTLYPDPVEIALAAERAGADAITLHLREDRRHIQERDIELLKHLLQTRMNLEMATNEDMIDFALRIRPEDCCLVPERREELTTEGGLDVVAHQRKIRSAYLRLVDAGIRVSLFIDAEISQVEAAAATGAPVIELHTGHYANSNDQMKELGRLALTAQTARDFGLQVNAGHGLNYHNVQAVAGIPEISELNIGHAIIAHALHCGISGAVRDMKRLINEARTHP
jgi:pyridoxine 5-phosphate synthase